jgi:hypothetical protein
MWGILIAHFGIRQIISHAAWNRDLETEKFNFQGTVSIMKRNSSMFRLFPHQEFNQRKTN